VDFTIKPPDPMSATIDHIVPVSKGGHPSDISNLQLAHRACNRKKSDKMIITGPGGQRGEVSNRILPLSHDWRLA
jgi:5-methylcytosine-specific restriction endonuclease McrA